MRSIAAHGRDLPHHPRLSEGDARGGRGARRARRCRLLGVTVLTSMDDGDLERAGYAGSAAALVERRAADARAAGMDGIVASPAEAAAVRAHRRARHAHRHARHPAGGRCGGRPEARSRRRRRRSAPGPTIWSSGGRSPRRPTRRPRPRRSSREIEAAMRGQPAGSMNMARDTGSLVSTMHGPGRLRALPSRLNRRCVPEISAARFLVRGGKFEQSRRASRCRAMSSSSSPSYARRPSTAIDSPEYAGAHDRSGAALRRSTSSSSRAMTARSPDIRAGIA